MFGLPGDISYEILGAKYDFDSEMLELILDNYATLKIKKPSGIIDEESQLIIREAEYTLLEWRHISDNKKTSYIKISCQNSNCHGESNQEQNFNALSAEKPAVLWKW
ncbi:MAG: hypothetical protein IPO92_02700 [Saprospiraceae bacterium]|nr:hypothetical protein [Saprospiraceae bacterium]